MQLLQSFFSRILGQGRKIGFLRPFLDTIIQDKDITELVKGSGIALVFKMISLPLGLATSLIISRLYGADAMGLYGLMTTIMGIAVSVGLWGMGAAMPRFLGEIKAKEDDQKKQHGQIQAVYRTGLVTIIAVSIVLSFMLFFSAELIGVGLFDEVRLVLPLQVAAFLLIPFVWYSYNTQFLISDKKIYHSEVVTKLIVPGCMLLGLVGCFFRFPGDVIPVWMYLGSGMVGLAASLWFMRRERFVSVRGTLANWKEMIKVSSPMWMTGIASIIIFQMDKIIVGAMFSIAEVGIYTVSLFLLNFLLLTPINIIRPILMPYLSEHYWSSNTKKFNYIIRLFTIGSFVYVCVSYIFLLLFGYYILQIRGEIFNEGYIILIILGLGNVIDFFFGPDYDVLMITGQEKFAQKRSRIICIINFILSLFFAYIFGIAGIAIATLCSYLIRNIVVFHYMKYRLHMYTNFYSVVTHYLHGKK